MLRLLCPRPRLVTQTRTTQWSNRTLWTEIQPSYISIWTEIRPSYISIWKIEFRKCWGRTQTPWTNQTRGKPQFGWTNDRGRTLSRNWNWTRPLSIFDISMRRTLDRTKTTHQPNWKSIFPIVTVPTNEPKHHQHQYHGRTNLQWN